MKGISDPAALECVLFDYGNVLCPRQDPACVAEMIRLLGIEESAFIDRYDKSRREYDLGGIEGIEYWNRFLRTLGIETSEALCRALREADVASWTPIDQEIIDLAFALQRRGLKIGILSNMPMEEAKHFRRIHEWMERFDHLFLSSELGMVKPDKAIYQHVIETLDLPASSILFIDDRAENIESARSMGWQGFLYESKSLSFPKLSDSLAEAVSRRAD